MNEILHDDRFRLMRQVNSILEASVNMDDRIIRDFSKLGEVADALRALNKQISMTAGVYDMIHVGHARYLREAKALGHILVVSVDSDALTKQRKGPARPVVPEDERIEMLLHLRYVDIVTVRDVNHGADDDILAVRPNVLITSSTTSDFKEEKKNWLRGNHGIEVTTLQAQAQTSTSAKIRGVMLTGADDLRTQINDVIEHYISGLRG